MQPDAIHIGFSKCASTFLQAYFDQHPQIYLVNQSHYLAPFALSSFPDGNDSYKKLFDGAGSGQVALESDEHIVLPLFHPVLGSAATTLESVVEVAARISSIRPGARIIVVIRNQVGMLISRYSEYILCGGIRSFAEFVGEFLCCSSDGINYYQNYYSRILDILVAEFGAKNVLMLLQEELAQDEDSTISALSEFLDVEFLRPEERGMVSRRVGLSDLGIKVVRCLNKLVVREPKQSYKEAEVRVPFLIYKVLQRGLRVLDYYLPRSIKGNKEEILTSSIENRIRATFGEDNARLSEMLGRDISDLGY